MIKRLKKTGKYFLFTLIAVIVSINLFIILSGKFYIYKGLTNTYFVGKLRPGIYDKDFFYTSSLDPGVNKDPWMIDEFYNKQVIPQKDREMMEKLNTKAFLVFKGDSLLYEEYWDTHEIETVSNSWSMAKTVVGILVGIAIDEGEIGSIHDHVSKYIPDYKVGDRSEITIHNLLTMSSGLDWGESASNPLSDNAESLYGPELNAHVKRQKLINKPGKTFDYMSGNTQLLGIILQKATGKSVSVYAEEKIWKKIGMEYSAHWSLDKENGDEKAFCCLYSTARDFGKIGKLINNGGMYKGEQIIPANYYKEMVSMADLTTLEGIKNQRYGLHIWLYEGLTNPVYYCRGYMGQYIISIPNEDLTIVRLGDGKKTNFLIPESLKNNKAYVDKNKVKVGHAKGLFKYIEIGKMIVSQTKSLRNER